MAAAAVRPLPGVRFEAPHPPVAEVLPRMDIALFIGFAASGPIDVPVRIEAPDEFTTIFGEDAPLAWDAARGEQLFAYLGPAVRAFFRDGGRRCWVVRVARGARFNLFPVPGVLRAHHGALSPAYARARSEGSWSDGLRVGAALDARPIEPVWFDLGRTAQLAVPATELQPGDVVRLTFRDGHVAVFRVDTLEALAGSPPFERATTEVVGSEGQTLWFSESAPAGIENAVAVAQLFTAGGAGTSMGPERVGAPPAAEASVLVEAPVLNDFSTWLEDDLLSLDLDLGVPPADPPEPGALVRIKAAGHELWIAVREVAARGEGGGVPAAAIRIRGVGRWRLSGPPAMTDSSPVAAERLRMSLLATSGTAQWKLSDLGLGAHHARFWNDLPVDADRFAPRPPGHGAAEAGRPPLFPLAGDGSIAALYVPIDLAPQVGPLMAPVRTADTPLHRDGLARLDSSLFLDPDLADTGFGSLASEADFLRYSRVPPRALRGIHTAFDVDEATLVAVPDAVHRGWSPQVPDAPAAPVQSPPPVRPRWWRFRNCWSTDPLPAVSEPEWWRFLPCGIRRIEPPALRVEDVSSRSGTWTLVWSGTEEADRYVLEESPVADFSTGSTALYAGAAERFTVYGRPIGDYYYRVRTEQGAETSDWSNSVLVRNAMGTGWQVDSPETYTPFAMVDVHRALLRLAAARGDMLAVLALPEHYREQDAIQHAAALAGAGQAGVALSPGPDAQTSGYGALYHPWLVGREPGETGALRHLPPDGAACGIMARRATHRGAWTAPANEPFRGVVGLTPGIPAAMYQELQDAQVNLIRQEPRGTLALSADTLSRIPELRPINVRRLLSLLRRLALRLGATYVFEPHDDAFRRLVQRGFEVMLDRLFLRGAFAGATASTSYQVVVSASLNTPASVDQGRFIVELRVAPSHPLRFLTVRLVQSGDRGLVAEVR